MLPPKGREVSPQRQILKGDSLVTATQQAHEPNQKQEDGRHGLDYFPPPITSMGRLEFWRTTGPAAPRG
jgi:hypothetical protein